MVAAITGLFILAAALAGGWLYGHFSTSWQLLHDLRKQDIDNG